VECGVHLVGKASKLDHMSLSSLKSHMLPKDTLNVLAILVCFDPVLRRSGDRGEMSAVSIKNDASRVSYMTARREEIMLQCKTADFEKRVPLPFLSTTWGSGGGYVE